MQSLQAAGSEGLCVYHMSSCQYEGFPNLGLGGFRVWGTVYPFGGPYTRAFPPVLGRYHIWGAQRPSWTWVLVVAPNGP